MFKLPVLAMSVCLLLTPVAQAKIMLVNTRAQNPAQLSAINLQKSEAFFASNKKKAGVKTLPNGLQYKIIKNGHGNSPTADDYVTVYYQATLLDGTVFTRAERPNAPNTLELSTTIPGLVDALQQMKPGAKWMVYIPPQLAYGTKGIRNKVPSNSALIFEIELVAIVPAPDESVTGVLEELKEN